MFVCLALQNLQTGFNKIIYRCTLYRNKAFNEAFNSFFLISATKNIYGEIFKIYEQIWKKHMFVIITSVLFDQSPLNKDNIATVVFENFSICQLYGDERDVLHNFLSLPVATRQTSRLPSN